jgi:chloramphenicol 3-O-phosphotransferase
LCFVEAIELSMHPVPGSDVKQNVQVFAVVLTGPPGAGKSTALEALTDALHDDGLRHASIEIEAISWAHPALTQEQRLRHLRALSDLYRNEGFDLILVAAPVASTSSLNDLLAALHAKDHLLVRFDAPDETLRQRIVSREPAGWSQLDKLLERARELRETMASLDGVHLSIDTHDVEPSDVVRQIRAYCPRLRRG